MLSQATLPKLLVLDLFKLFWRHMPDLCLPWACLHLVAFLLKEAEHRMQGVWPWRFVWASPSGLGMTMGCFTLWTAAPITTNPGHIPSPKPRGECSHPPGCCYCPWGVAVWSSCTRTVPCPRPAEKCPPLGDVRRCPLLHCKPWSRLVPSRLEVCVWLTVIRWCRERTSPA